jgi:hypothetical protein
MFLVFYVFAQGKVREIVIDAIEGAAAAQSDSVSLAAVEIALRHRLLEGRVFQPILDILRDFDSADASNSASLLSSPFLQQTLTACSWFDDLPCSVIERLFSLRCEAQMLQPVPAPLCRTRDGPVVSLFVSYFLCNNNCHSVKLPSIAASVQVGCVVVCLQ